MDLDLSLEDKKKKKGSQRRRKSMFSEQKDSALGAIISLIISAVAFLALLVLSVQSGGNSGILAGGIGMLMWLAVIVGFIVAITSFWKKEISLKYPVFGVIANGILILIYGLVYLSGTGFF